MCLYPKLSANIQQDCKSASGHKAVFSRSLKAFIWDSSRLEFEAARLVVIVIIYVSVKVYKTVELNCNMLVGKRGTLMEFSFPQPPV